MEAGDQDIASVGLGDKSSESSDYDSDGESELAGSYTTDCLTSVASTECTSSTVTSSHIEKRISDATSGCSKYSSAFCSGDKQNHPPVIYKSEKGKHGRSVCGVWFCEYSWRLLIVSHKTKFTVFTVTVLI